MIIYFVMAFAVLCAFAFILIQTLNKPLLSFVLKMIASMGFIILGIIAVNESYEFTMGLLLLLGGIFGLCGDVMLGLKEFKFVQGNKPLITGIGTFMIGHVLYYSVMVILFGFNIYVPFVGIIIAAVIYLSGRKMKMNYGGTVIPTYLYAFILASTMAQAFFVMLTTGFTLPGIFLFIGFTLFLVSDLLLSFIYFLPENEKRSKPIRILNLSTYYLAQIIIMFTICLL